MMTIYIQFSNFFVCEKSTDLTALKNELPATVRKSLRKSSRFSLIAAQPLANNLSQLYRDEMSGLYFASERGPLANTEACLQDFKQGTWQLMPFSFLNVGINSACFDIAQLVNINGKSLALSDADQSFATALKIACNDLRSKTVSSALVGTVDEHLDQSVIFTAPSHIHEHNHPNDGAAWVNLTLNPDAALAKLDGIYHFPTLQQAETWLRQQTYDENCFFTLPHSLKVESLAVPDGLTEYRHPAAKTCFTTAQGVKLAAFVKEISNGHLFHITKGAQGTMTIIKISALLSTSQ
ncbi:MAG TPA: hypothetical protein DIT58_05125 [Porticoccaceae bacterium]|nr:hypothetical protein [Porticoccaceae bacterium]